MSAALTATTCANCTTRIETHGSGWVHAASGSKVCPALAGVAVPGVPSAPVTLRFDRLPTGELVAIHTHEGRSVAAVVHPAGRCTPSDRQPQPRWVLAGDVDWETRRAGAATSAAAACMEAARALGDELGIEIDLTEFEVPR